MPQYLYTMQWPRENLFMDCFAHQILNYRYHWHLSEIELDIILHGNEDLCCGSENTLLEEDDVVLISPGVGHATFGLQENTQALVLHVSSLAFKPFLKRGSSFLFPNIHSDASTRQDPLFRRIRFYSAQILDAAHRDDPFAKLTAKACLELLIATLCTRCNPETVPDASKENTEHQETVHRLILYLEEHYTEKVSLEDLARFSQYNRTYLSTIFKNTLGINFYEYLVRFRLQKALFDLSTTQKNLTEIAIGNGFSDLKSFNRRFRDTFSCSPAEYRTRLDPSHVIRTEMGRLYCSPEEPVIRKKLLEYMNI